MLGTVTGVVYGAAHTQPGIVGAGVPLKDALDAVAIGLAVAAGAAALSLGVGALVDDRERLEFVPASDP